MQSITRRHALRTLALVAPAVAVGALPVLAGPAVTGPDPIFAAIAEHRRLFKRSYRLYDALRLAEEKAEETHGRRPWSLIAWDHYSAIGGSEIEARRDALLRRPGADPKKIEAKYLDAKAREQAAKRAGTAWDKAAGLTAQQREYEQSRRAEHGATLRMARTKPTTPAGAAALLAYVKHDMEAGEIGWHAVALGTSIMALKAMAVQS
jgi:hypothetical protein